MALIFECDLDVVKTNFCDICKISKWKVIVYTLTHCVNFAPGRAEKYCGDHVCVFVCPQAYLWKYTFDLHQFFALVNYGHGL